MSDYKKITEKQIFVIVKRWEGGKLEFENAYWEEAVAKQSLANNINLNSLNPARGIFTVNLHGYMIDKA